MQRVYDKKFKAAANTEKKLSYNIKDFVDTDEAVERREALGKI